MQFKQPRTTVAASALLGAVVLLGFMVAQGRAAHDARVPNLRIAFDKGAYAQGPITVLDGSGTPVLNIPLGSWVKVH